MTTDSDNDQMMLVHWQESLTRNVIISIYMVDFYEVSQLQKVVETLENLQKAKKKGTMQSEKASP